MKIAVLVCLSAEHALFIDFFRNRLCKKIIIGVMSAPIL